MFERISSFVLWSIKAVLIVGSVAVLLVLRYKARHPNKSFTVACYNVLATPLRVLGLGIYEGGEVSPERAMAEAKKLVQLEDFGSLAFVERYKAAEAAMKKEGARYSNLGFIIASIELRDSCVRRLLMVDYLRIHPAIQRVKLPSPIFVIGLGRSGTTLLHRLLALDPNRRAPLGWELCKPVPDRTACHVDASAAVFQADRQRRMEESLKSHQAYEALGNGSTENLHESGFDLPVECMHGMSDELPTAMHLMAFTGKAWFDLRDSGALTDEALVQGYEAHRRILQLLSYQTARERGAQGEDVLCGDQWVLKFPTHLNMLPQLAQVFPDAKLVWAHRHPLSCTSSMCSLIRLMVDVFYDTNPSYDTRIMGPVAARRAERSLSEAMRDLDTCGLPCSHVRFEDLVSDPLSVVKTVHEELGLEFSAQHQANIEAYLARDKQHREILRNARKDKKALHAHRSVDFGLTRALFAGPVFETYLQRFRISAVDM